MIDSAPAPVVIATFRSITEAQVARSAIASAGIEALPSNAYNIVVAPADADRALEVLESIWPDEPAPELEVNEVERCPECGSPDPIRIRRLPFFMLITTLLVIAGHAAGQLDLFSILIAVIAGLFFFGPNRRCTSCGARWKSWKIVTAERDVPVEAPVVACPRCGSPETYPLDRRRQKAWTLLVNFTLPPLLLIWPFMAKRKCEECGHEF